MSNWEQFDKSMDKGLLDDIKNTAANTGDFEELPLGKYEVAVSSMELKESKKGYPMVATCFKVVAGDYENRLIFKNSVVYMGDQNDKYRMSSELKFLKSLGSSKQVVFDGFVKFDRLVTDIFNEIDSNGLEYLLEITEHKGFRNYTIKEIYEPEPKAKAQDDEEDIPF